MNMKPGVQETVKKGSQEKKKSPSYLLRKSLNQLEKVAINTVERSKEVNRKEPGTFEEKLQWLKEQRHNVEKYVTLLENIISEGKELEKEWKGILSTVKKDEFFYEMELYEQYMNRNEGLFGRGNKVRLRRASLIATLNWIKDEIANIQKTYETEKEKSLEVWMEKLATRSRPPIKFDGDSQMWEVFISQFEELIDKRTDMSNAQKFAHLLGCLKGEARKVVSGLAVNGENYSLAMQNLRRRYGDKQKRVFELYIRLQHLCYSEQEPHKMIEEMLNILSQLKRLDENLETNQMWSLIVSKLPANLTEKLVQKKLEEPEWNIENTLKFFKEILNIAETVEMTKQIGYMAVGEKQNTLPQNQIVKYIPMVKCNYQREIQQRDST